MSFDEQLRAALNLEAEMREVPQPDLQGLISGGRVRRRRRSAARIGTAAAVAVLVGGGAYGVMQLDSESTGAPEITEEPTQPPTTPSPLSEDRPPMEPGTHRLSVGLDAEFEVMEAEVTVDGPGWRNSGGYPLVSEGRSRAGVGVYQPSAVAGRTGCTSSWESQSRDAGETPQDLARQLTRLPRSTVLQPPTPTEAFGRDTIHLKLRINDNCPVPENYQVAEDRGITYSNLAQDIVIDFWVLDLGGAPVVVDMWHQSGSSVQLMDRVAQARDSISFVPAE